MSNFSDCFGTFGDDSLAMDVLGGDEELSREETTISSPIQSLPSEIVASIFLRIPNPERNKFSQVCRSWKAIMDALIGTKVRIGTYSDFDPEGTEGWFLTYHSPAIIERIGINELYVGDMSDNWQADHGWIAWGLDLWDTVKAQFKRTKRPPAPCPLPSFMTPSLLSLINIFGKITPYHFNHFIREVHQWLKSFSVGFYSLQCLSPEDLKLNLPQLEIFKVNVGITENNEELMDCLEFEKIYINIITLLDANTYPKLRHAQIQFIYDSNQDLSITQVLLKFLKVHGKTLDVFQIDYAVLLSQELSSVNSTDESFILLESANSLKTCHLNLKGLQIFSTCCSKLPNCAIWTDILSQQSSLEDIALKGVSYEPQFMGRLVQTNYKSLISIHVFEIKFFDPELNSVNQLDCGIFSRCARLKKLALRGWKTTLRVNSLMNAEHLPRCLKHIEFHYMAVETSSIREIALNLPNLEYLLLCCVGNRRNMGMDVTTLKQIINQRRLKTVKMIYSLNGKFDGVHNGNKEDPETIEETEGRIAFEMRPTGYYSNIYGDIEPLEI